MNSKYNNLLAGKDQTIRALWFSLLITASLGALMGAGWMSAPKHIRVHIPPDLETGAVLRTDEVRKANVYTFAFYLWQQLNRWEKDGRTDYRQKIASLKNYMTPACHQDRLDDYAVRDRKHELFRRERAIWEIPGRNFSNDRVYREGQGSWVAYIDVQIRESMIGEPIKTRFVNYPIRVVRYNIDPELNPFGLAIDCLAGKAKAIEVTQSKT